MAVFRGFFSELNRLVLSVLILFLARSAFGQEHSDHRKHVTEMSKSSPKSQQHSMGIGSRSRVPFVFGPLDCNKTQTWDTETGMCMPLPQSGHKWMTMIHGNGFLVYTNQSGPRGKDAVSSPNMVMGNFGRTIHSGHFLNLNVMLTAERWTFPEDGYPLILQIGEHNAQGRPYIDSQHPHSSPLMGLTLSDTIAMGDDDYLKVFVAPRGQPTDGPIAFMHRPSGMFSPDAPLGHHIGQDVAHISSTVLGASLKLGSSRYQLSVFNGTEPEPAKVDLPIGPLNSYSARYVLEPADGNVIMLSGAFIKNPEPHEPNLDSRTRYSGSFYKQVQLENGSTFHNSLILGAITSYDEAPILWSLNEEAVWISGANRPWFRLEVLQRNARQLQIASVTDQNSGKWNGLLTAGFNRAMFRTSELEASLGLSGSIYVLAPEFHETYGQVPWGFKIYFQVGGMKMWMPDSQHN